MLQNRSVVLTVTCTLSGDTNVFTKLQRQWSKLNIVRTSLGVNTLTIAFTALIQLTSSYKVRSKITGILYEAIETMQPYKGLLAAGTERFKLCNSHTKT